MSATAESGRPRTLRQRLRTDFAVACLAGIAAVHLLEVSGMTTHAPIWAAAFIGLALAAITVAILLNRLWWRHELWIAAATLGLLPMLGYVLSRATPIPNLGAHVGQWVEPLGLAALLFEVTLLGLSTWALIPAARIAPAANLASAGVLALVALGATTSFPVATGCDQRVMLSTESEAHHDDPAAYTGAMPAGCLSSRAQ